jgi:hypothetical protein
MRMMARVGAALTLSVAGTAIAADIYAIREDFPETGSSILKAALVWPVPINRRYEELTAEQQRIVRDDYVKLGPADEPAYPSDGMASILADVAKIQTGEIDKGLLHLAVRVDAAGHPRGVALLNSPNNAISQAVSYSLMHATYKPAKCDGRPCDSDFSFKYRFKETRPHTSRGDWNPVMWIAPLHE